MDAERARMQERDSGQADWAKWGPYLSERQWGTVREDYSADGNAWTYFPHEMARSRAYRWGEDGLHGICDCEGRVCFAPAFWNGRDPILKERLFGLGNPQGNHGEDVKEAYFYLDNVPTHSWMQALYKYPQAAFPYERLVEENARRNRDEPEFELGDTGIFDESRYFDLFIEYAKAGPDDLGIRIRAINRGPDPAPLTVLPTLWFRNVWSWDLDAPPAPEIHAEGKHAIRARIKDGDEFVLTCDGATEWLFTGNDTNAAKLFGGKNASPYVKDAFHRCIVDGDRDAVNPTHRGTKAAAVLRRVLAPGEEWSIGLRLAPESRPAAGEAFDRIFADRRIEADAFYADLAPSASAEWLAVKRQALAGLLWTKQFYFFNVLRWRKGDPTQPPPPPNRAMDRNAFWTTLYAFDVISMPDKWEYPFFCAWDLDFQSVAFAPFDPAFAKEQFHVLRRENYVSASSQTPAYEWNFSDANPPIGAWAAWRIYSIDRARNPDGRGDTKFLKEAFYRLLLAYGWWANRVDASGDNIFAGGFLGLDNIGAFDRRYPLPDGSVVEQSDGTGWMAAYSLNMLRIALELAREDETYVPAADKFLVDFIHLAWVTNTIGPNGISLWDHADGFYYDVLRRPDGSSEFLKLRSLVGITPLLAVETLDEDTMENCDFLQRRLEWIRIHRPQFLSSLEHLDFTWATGKKLFSLVPEDRMRRIFRRLFDEKEFLSSHGIRSLSKAYETQPYEFIEGSEHATIPYSPGDSPVAMFGGNSNWRGPIWMPMNFLLIEALQKFHFYFGDDFTVEYPTGSGQRLNLWDISLDLQRRLIGLFCRDASGHRPCFGDDRRYASDPHWQGLVQFFEYFHGDTGRGLGASHQTGWTALVAKMVQQVSTYQPGQSRSEIL